MRTGSMMLLLLLFTAFPLTVAGQARADARTDNKPAQREDLTFSNQDLEKYKPASDNKAQAVKPPRTEEKKEKTQKTEEQKEKEYWCKRAEYYAKKIEKAQDEVDKQEERLDELKDAASRELGKQRKLLDKEIKKTRKKLESARKQVAARERDMARIKEEAHKKGVPPGWLRCQFTW
ncbi:MAG TPA: hypothetical protein VF790_02270 [Dissulfurispiraceae bacterium]